MSAGTLHTTWLSLIDRSGPFLSVQVLESALPQGLEAVQTKFKQKLRLAYEEWRDAIDNGDPQLKELHKEWIKLVLADILEYDKNCLVPNSLAEIKYTNEELAVVYAPTFVVKSPVSNKVRFFIETLPPESDIDKPLEGDPWPVSVAEKMTLLCRSQKIRYGLITNGEKWTIVSAPVGATSGTATWYARLWRYEPVTLKAFQTLLGVRRCFGAESETLDTLLDSSLNSYEEVTNTLGEQVRRAVEVLIQSLDSADQDRNRELLEGIPPSELYDSSVTVMMRLVFLLCAEERGLLLLGDPIYDQFYAVTTLRAQLAEEAGKLGPEVLERRHDAWSRLLATFRAVFGGIEHEALRLPPLGGSLFDPDKYPFLEGRRAGSSWKQTDATPLPIDNRTVLLLLTALQVLEQKGGALHLSYRALDVEQIGHVYEGLLDKTVRRTDDITVGFTGAGTDGGVLISVTDLVRNSGTEEQVADFLAGRTGRSKNTILRAIQETRTDEDYGRVLLACSGNEELASSLKRYFSVIKKDIWGNPLIYPKGSYAVTSGLDRRESGTHYTPKSLTEIIVQKTLEPLVFDGPSEGLKREHWKIKSSEKILNLKVCDPAMGSAAFLVQSCRYLSEHLVLAWRAEKKDSAASTHDLLLKARRLISEKCLYGVDKNPLAVELSKLSLWLITLSKGKPFEFLDHNLRVGDSLLGIISTAQLLNFTTSIKSEAAQIGLFDEYVSKSLSDCIALREKVRNIEFKSFDEVNIASAYLKDALGKIEALKLVSDVISTYELENTKLSDKPSAEILKIHAVKALSGDGSSRSFFKELLAKSSISKTEDRAIVLTPFNWLIEFPEVFAEGGFSAIVGNPPFLGNKYWKSMLGWHTQSLAKAILNEAPGKIDLCVVFHRRMVDLLRAGGTYGLLATNNIAEGSAITVGLGNICSSGNIIWAMKGYPWPGTAAVEVAIITFYKGDYQGEKELNGNRTTRIGSRLEEENHDAWSPKKLANRLFAFEGVHNGKGLSFLLDQESPWFEQLKNERNSILRPYFSGEDITDSAALRVNRWALDIGDRSLSEIQSNWPLAYQFLTTVVQPTRTEQALKSYKGLFQRWWQFWNNRSRQFAKLREFPNCISFSKNTKYPVGIYSSSNDLYTNKAVLICDTRNDTLAIVKSNVFQSWISHFSGGRIEGRLQISIKEAINKFPLPPSVVSQTGINAAAQLTDLEKSWSRENGSGLTDFYNNVYAHSNQTTAFVQARSLIKAVDKEVLAAYGFNFSPTYSFDVAGQITKGSALTSDSSTELVKLLTDRNKQCYEAQSSRDEIEDADSEDSDD